LTPHHLRIAAELLDFHRCPNTGRVLHSTKGDDKAFCRCGQPNPHLPNETLHAHFKEFMAKATVDDFVEQELWSGVVDRHAPGLRDTIDDAKLEVDGNDVKLTVSGRIKEAPTANPTAGSKWFWTTDGNLRIQTPDGKSTEYPLKKEDE
jgi:hypothetical protein